MTGISLLYTSTAYVSPREIEEEVFTRALEKARVSERMVLEEDVGSNESP
ncbi:MAG: hypothetical protein ACLR6J_09755 [Parabacteroides merdae]